MSSKNKIARLQLVALYGEICMLGEPITKSNYITYHHILKKALGGQATVENGALLSRYMHELTHLIEMYYPGEYRLINEFLVYYKATKDDIEKENMNRHVKILERKIR